MNAARAWRKPRPWETGLALSLLLHLLVVLFFSWRWRIDAADGAVDPLEIDLTRPFRITDNPALAHKAKNPGAGAPVVEKPTPVAGKGQAGGEEVSPEGKGAVKDWKLPDAQTPQVLEKPVDAAPAGRADGAGEGAGSGGLGTGVGDGEVDIVYLTQRPRLVNKEDVLRYTWQFYPHEERAAQIEACLNLVIHLNEKGRVVQLDIVKSAGAHFDEAARKVISKAVFSPGRAGSQARSTKFGMPLCFYLEDPQAR